MWKKVIINLFIKMTLNTVILSANLCTRKDLLEFSDLSVAM